ncbi:MAG: phenylalanine--tRNA ligase subunit beta [Lachnospiraceae bacterium]|nr:phenylalanine--tRNA ligase subunit beta [Lachnospiraceae bacterium]
MKLSLNWIRDYVDLPEDLTIANLSYDLTMTTVEVEGTEEVAKSFENIIVGQILEVLPHPNADKLRVCKVNTGDGVHEIVCGGSNLEAGMYVAVAVPGAMVRWHGEGEPVKIKNSKLRGVESYGMICASTEIGLGDLFPPKDEAEIVDLKDFPAEPGTNLAVALGIDDVILEIDNKSMTNRPDLWGHYGMARELAAIYDCKLKPIEPYKAPEGIPAFDIRIEDADRCPRYIGVKLEGLCVKEAPFYMRARLWETGLRPINALVDITNYVMLAVGQPTHAFDSDHICDYIRVRRAEEGEHLDLLNGKDLALDTEDLVIADSKEAVALAGVMGGAKDSILPDTQNVILEVANFAATGVRKTALRYDNRTDASTRYEKGIDPERCDQALAMAMELFAELYPGMKVTAFADDYRKKLVPAEIDVSYDWLDRRLGKHLTQEEISYKLGLMGFSVSFDGDNMHITVPTWRSTGDVSIKADIMEEVARMYGYENFKADKITTTFTGAINQLDKSLVRSIEEYLAYRCGLQEVLTYPWMREEFVNAILGSTEGILTLSTPPSPEEKYIHSSTLPNLCQAVVSNERYYSEFAIFEEAQVALADEFISPYDETEKLPRQSRRIGCAFAKKTDGIDGITALFRQAKGIFENMPRYTHMESFTFRKEEKPYWADMTVWLNIFVGEEMVGSLGLLGKRQSMACGIKNLSVVLAEIDTDKLLPFKSRTNTFTHLAAYPVNDYDLSMIVDASVTWEEIRKCVMAKKGDLVKDVTFVDEYRGKQIPKGKKSVTVRLAVGAADRTLTSEEIEKCAGRIIKQLTKVLGAEIRSK